MHQLKYFYIIFLLLCISGAYSQIDSNGNVLSDTIFEKTLKEGNLSHLLSEVPNSPDLQLERLAAYFFHQRINQYRLDNGLSTLYWDDRIWLAARNHNLYLWKLNALTHDEVKTNTFFTGNKPWDRIQYVTYNNYKMEYYAENCLFYTNDFYTFNAENAIEIANRAFEQWKNSPGHNKNMLDPKHFAHGTSFIMVGDRLYGTTNFGNASDFIKNEISINWNDSLAKLYLPNAEEKRKPYVATNWSVQVAEKELFNVVLAKMPKQKSTNNSDLTLAATMGMKGNNGIENDSKKVASTKQRYLKASKNLILRLIFSKLHEKVYRFQFTKEQLTDKSALKVIDESISKELPASTKIDCWGGKCRLVSKDSLFVCDINLIYVIKKK